MFSNKVKRMLTIILAIGIFTYDSNIAYAVTQQPEEEVIMQSDDNDLVLSEDVNIGLDNETGEFYRELSEDELCAKDAASMDENQISQAVEGDDYLADEVIALCESLDEAEHIAGAYEESTGYTVKVDSYSYGVAVLKMYGKPDKDKIAENAGEYVSDNLNSVETFVMLAASPKNNLPAVYPNYMREAYSTDTTNEDEFTDPMLKEDSEGYEGMYQWYHDIINDKYAWKLVDNGTLNINDVHVAVIDSGINYDHNDFGANVSSHTNYVDKEINDYTEDDSTEYEKTGGDSSGHGTNVAGIIGNIANTIGGRGVAAGVMIDSYRVLGRWGSSYDDSVLRGINAAIYDKKDGNKNIRVINLSLGGAMYNSAYEGILREAKDNGILVIASAGNDNTSARRYPAAFENVMSVAALNDKYERSDFSNYGSSVDISAPGGEGKLNSSEVNYETKPLWASGKAEIDDGIRTVEGNNYVGMNGTSQAAPVVSGCAALLFAMHPEYTPEEAEAVLEATAKPLKSKYQMGAGCVDIGSALNISTSVPAPVADINSGIISSGQSLTLSMPEGYDYSKYAMIYYTLNGKKPFDSKTPIADIHFCKPGGTVTLEGAGKVNLCMQALVFGNESDSVSYIYTFEESGVESITVKFPGNLEAKALKSSGTSLLPDDGSLEIALGKTVSAASTVLPAYAKNKKITWISDNTDIASVDSSGRIKGVNPGTTVVSAHSPDNLTVVNIPVKVMPAPDQVVIGVNSIALTVGDTEKIKISDMYISVYPAIASQKINLKSSDTKVAVVNTDEENNQFIEAVSPGNAVITATTVDGSNISDSVEISVGAKIKKIEISDPTGKNVIFRDGAYFKPKVVLNGGDSVTVNPDDVNWEISSGINNEYLESNSQGLRIKRTYAGTLPMPVTIRAYSGTGDNKVYSNELSMTLYETAIALNPSEFAVYYDYFQKGMLLNLSELFDIQPEGAYKELKYTCKSGVKINQNMGTAIIQTAGKKITIKAETLDGSNLSCDVNIYPYEEDNYITGINCKSGNAILYPGKSIQLEAVQYKSGKLMSAPGFCIYENETRYKEKNGLKINGNSVTGQSSLKNVMPGTKQEVLLYYTYTYRNGRYVYASEWNSNYSMPIELYPAGISSVKLTFAGSDEPVNGGKVILKPGDTRQIIPSSLPENACQKYYTYKSGNTKVVTVDSNGRIKAVGNGKATVTVTAGDGSNKNAMIDFTVARLATDISIGSKTGSFTVIPGKNLNLTATVLPADTVDKKVKWSIVSGNEHATINATNGTVSARTPGVVTVKVTNESSGVSKTQNITVSAATGSITMDDPAIVKNGMELYTQNAGSCSKTDSFTFTIASMTDGMRAQDPDVTVSNTGMAEVIRVGDPKVNGKNVTYTYKVTAKGDKAGNTSVNIAALDGSGKKLSFKVKTLIPVTDLQITSPGGISTLTPGKSIKLSAAVNQSASNKGVVWSFNNDDEKSRAATLGVDTGSFENKGTLTLSKNASSSGDFNIKATAADGSGKSQQLKVSVRTRQVTSVEIKDGDENVRSTTLGTYRYAPDADRSDNFAIERLFTVNIASVSNGVAAGSDDYQTSPIVTSSNEAIAKAMIDADQKTLHVYTYKNEAGSVFKVTKTGKATITVKASDGSNKSASLTVNVAEPARNIYLSSNKTTRNIAANGKITMKATVQSSASNKKVVWSLLNEEDSELSKDIATISASGMVSPNKDLAEKTEIYVVATAADGSGTTNKEKLTLYPAQGKISFKDNGKVIGSDGLTLNVGDTKTIDIKGEAGACADYYVTYKTGPIRIQYISKTPESTSIKITAIKKGNSPVKAAALDESGKSSSISIKVN